MIIASTNYDRLTELLAEFAEHLERDAETVFITQAKALDLEKLFAESQSSLIFFGHGKPQPPSLLDQAREALWTVQLTPLLEKRVLYGNACHSLEALAEFGLARIGFAGKLEVCDDSAYFEAQRECILAGPRALLNGKTVSEAVMATKEAYRTKQRELFRGQFIDTVVATRVFKANADRIAYTGDGDARVRMKGEPNG